MNLDGKQGGGGVKSRYFEVYYIPIFALYISTLSSHSETAGRDMNYMYVTRVRCQHWH